MAGLTTHILDVTHGQPAANTTIELYRLEGSQRNHIKTKKTNSDGRLDEPLLTGDELEIGEYELVFHVGAYFKAKKVPLAEPVFLDKVPVRFGVSQVRGHYHVPLLVSPWGYQVYRGS
ncbi:hydroxyisourate hydrolase [Radiobacillus sp. PE A8.2]|uniref:hydroxyisourate hydrolase n=1 Tax=Radiobacillus sp. PE A8.2 TaxID=3380349 RepID=UPI0038905197